MAHCKLEQLQTYVTLATKQDFIKMRNDKGKISDSDLARDIILEAIREWKKEKKKKA